MAEGAPLLRAYTLTRIEGSNPFLSATGFAHFSGRFQLSGPPPPPGETLSTEYIARFSRSVWFSRHGVQMAANTLQNEFRQANFLITYRKLILDQPVLSFEIVCKCGSLSFNLATKFR